MADNINKNLNMENLEDSELEQVSGGRKNPTKRPQKREPAKKHGFKGMGPCPRCGELKLPHRVCPNCGYDNEDKYINKL